jgi:hypothetical protein
MNIVGVGVNSGIGVGVTIVTLDPSLVTFNCKTTELMAGSLAALISSRPGRSILKEAFATPCVVDESIC